MMMMMMMRFQPVPNSNQKESYQPPNTSPQKTLHPKESNWYFFVGESQVFVLVLDIGVMKK